MFEKLLSWIKRIFQPNPDKNPNQKALNAKMKVNLNFKDKKQEELWEKVAQEMTEASKDPEWRKRLDELESPKKKLQMVMEKAIPVVREAVNVELPETWANYVNLLGDDKLKAQCVSVQKQHSNSSEGWFALSQEGRNAIAMVQVIEEIKELGNSVPDEVKNVFKGANS